MNALASPWEQTTHKEMGEEEFKTVASIYLGVYKNELKVASDSENNIFIWHPYAIDDENHPCHVGVVINKHNLGVITKNFDDNLQLHFPYADTFFQKDRTIQVCAD